MRLMEIDNVLKDLYESRMNFENKEKELTWRMVYHYLTKLGLPKEERKKRIKEFFPEWIATFKDNPNIEVFNSIHWTYFCQFLNDKIDINYCIKMYISLDSNHIKEGAKIIFDFLAKNNIKHNSKIGSDIRTDEIVIRVGNKEDAKKIQEFVSNNSYLQEGMNKINPFCFQDRGIGYTYEGRLSYNSCISQVIADYINDMYKLGQNQNNINTFSFYDYVDSYSKKFNKISSLPYIEDESIRIEHALLIIKLVKLSLGSDNIDDFFKFYDYVTKLENNNQKTIKNDEEDKEELFKEYILTTMKKYPKGYDENNPDYSGYDFINNYLSGNINGVTRDNNLRNRIKNNLTIPDIINILNTKAIPGDNYGQKINNYIKIIMLNEIIKSSNIRFPDHGIDQVNEYIMTGRLKTITNKIGNSRILAQTLEPAEIVLLFRNLEVEDIYDYVDKYYTEEKAKKIF